MRRSLIQPTAIRAFHKARAIYGDTLPPRITHRMSKLSGSFEVDSAWFLGPRPAHELCSTKAWTSAIARSSSSPPK